MNVSEPQVMLLLKVTLQEPGQQNCLFFCGGPYVKEGCHKQYDILDSFQLTLAKNW